jgi:hypothetical protein
MSETPFDDSKEYLVIRFSENLTKYDVQYLFESLKQDKGSLAAATKEIDIERKTVYDWDSNNSEIRLATKRKVLSACLNEDINKTIAYLMEKTFLDYSDVSQRYNNFLFEKIMTIEKKSELCDLISLFEKNLRANKVLFLGANEERISAMMEEVNKKAKAFEIAGIANDLFLMSTDKLENKFLLLIDILSEQKLRKQDIAKSLNLPFDFVEKACQVYGYLGPSEELNLKGKIRAEPTIKEIGQGKYGSPYLPTKGYIASRELI